MNLGVPKLVTIRQLSKAGIAPETAIRRMVSEGKIPVVRVGKWNYLDFGTACMVLRGTADGKGKTTY